MQRMIQTPLIPAQAGIQFLERETSFPGFWIPACAGMSGGM